MAWRVVELTHNRKLAVQVSEGRYRVRLKLPHPDAEAPNDVREAYDVDLTWAIARTFGKTAPDGQVEEIAHFLEQAYNLKRKLA